MKKVLSLVVAALFVSSSAFAATTVKNTIVATAAFAGEASFTFTLKTVNGDATATTLDWTKADAFNMGEDTVWVMADQYAEVYAKVTKAGYAVYMNTDNKSVNSSLEPNYTDWDTTTSPATPIQTSATYGGMYRVGSTGGVFRGYVPVLFSYVNQKNASLTFNGTVATTTARADRYLSDVSSASYDKNYTMIASLNGPTFGVDAKTGAWPGDCTNNTAYMYFFGGFQNIIGGDTYTTTIKVIEEVE